jgi:hypothetical protein
MGVLHTVKQGEHLARIALSYGFDQWQPVWNAAENADLRQSRSSPDVLMPGDSVYVPDLQTRTLSAATDKVHRFQMSIPPLGLKLVLLDRFNGGIETRPCSFDVGGDPQDMTTAGDGGVERKLTLRQKSVEDGSVTFKQSVTVNEQAHDLPVTLQLKIGHLDPVTEADGQVKRLRNLGYYPCADDEFDDFLFRGAVEEFQLENDLAVDGQCGPDTQAKLKDVHGC